MGETSRTANSTRNLMYGFVSQFIVLILNFIVRTVFIHYLGATYLGVNGLFGNILSILSLAEMGFGTAMTYNLYKPLAEKNEEEIQSLMNFYKTVYKRIGILVGLMGLAILPFLNNIIKDPGDIQNIQIIYIMFLTDSVCSYFFAYRRSILNADQKAYICSQYRYLFVIFKSIVQIISIVILNNFLVYLFIQILSTFLENLFISEKVLRTYPYLRESNVKPLSKKNITSIKKDVSALMLSKIANVALHGTDNIIISAFSSVKNVGLLSNYTLISGSLTMIISQVGVAMTGSIGNFFASESSERHYDLFQKIDFMYFNLYSFCFICMFILYNPFISVFFGNEYVFNTPIVFVFCLNYLIEGLLQSLWTFRTTMGLFVQGKYRPIIAASINIILSLILVQYFGVLGVLLGTTFSRLLVNAWFDPYIIFKYGLKKSPKTYFMTYGKRVIFVGVITFCLNIFKVSLFPAKFTFFSFFLLLTITVASTLLSLCVFSFQSKELHYYINIIKTLFKKIF